MTRSSVNSLLAAAVLSGCADAGPVGGEYAPGPEVCGYATAADVDPAEDVVEVEIEAAPATWDPGTGVPIDGYAYNGSVPGPLIVVDAGDTLRVRFRNGLDAESTIHWHGLRVPDDMDGVALMMDPVAPGGEFTYEFTVPDPGFYWYHPHMDTDQQIERGLYAPLLVRDHGEPAVGCDVAVLDDVLLDDDGQVAPPSDAMDGMMGRLGNLLLVNGRTDTRFEIAPGERRVLHLVHALTVLGTDGGWLAEPYKVERLVVAPGERYSVLVRGDGEAGETTALENSEESLGHSMMGGSEDPMGPGPNPIATYTSGDKPEEAQDPVFPATDPPSFEAGGPVTHRWVLAEDMSGMMGGGGGMLTIDGESWPDVPLLTYAGGEPLTFEVENTSDMRHPMHLHGQRFQVVAVGGVATPLQAWKDTVDVPAGSVVELVTLLDNPGDWMYHCHILEHAEDGMAGVLVVE